MAFCGATRWQPAPHRTAPPPRSGDGGWRGPGRDVLQPPNPNWRRQDPPWGPGQVPPDVDAAQPHHSELQAATATALPVHPTPKRPPQLGGPPGTEPPLPRPHHWHQDPQPGRTTSCPAPKPGKKDQRWVGGAGRDSPPPLLVGPALPCPAAPATRGDSRGGFFFPSGNDDKNPQGALSVPSRPVPPSSSSSSLAGLGDALAILPQGN